MLLKVADGWTASDAAEAFDVGPSTVANVCRRFCEGGVDAVLRDKRQERRRQALTGAQQARLVAIACSPVPDGHDHWTLRLLAGKAVELAFIARISPVPAQRRVRTQLYNGI